MKLEWSPSFAIGHKSIDDDHRRLFEFVNEFVSTQNLDSARQTVIRLHDYAKGHFGREEAILAAAGAPDLPSHRKEHEKLASAIHSLLLSHLVPDKAPSEKDVIQKVAALLENWIFHHVLVNDMKQKATVKQLTERINSSRKQAAG
ncbi:hypothetical protein CU669_17345 [Paramagnetospirillum kuznetsovii]|uniref:Hemerythrin-like domain-containing protein n=1 Tax=Paramagnetospirillum kuznetsovii TaxID=2053833 RepID=A0A364NUB8_9PROT|nr:hemerythrin domain-containing protein [Paramagnetospirillum kuznetsovii]RAU20600.1 hypothetical protein CU669_17345 [Paramagnetospirillum kuznetsovii]